VTAHTQENYYDTQENTAATTSITVTTMASNHQSVVDHDTTTTTDNNTTKDFGNPVQVNADKTFISRTAIQPNPASVQKDRKMREKTAHIGWKASQESQGNNNNNNN
jgi:hypothetical protein